MPCSSQPNGEFARAPTRIFVWRQSLRVGVRADGADPYRMSEPLRGARGGPRRRRVPAAQGSRRREAQPQGGRPGTLVEAAAAYRPDPGRPECGAGSVWRNGSTAAGVSRWRCRCCGRRFTSPTGTVLEHCRKPLPVWISFIRLMLRNVPVECAAELRGVTHKTAFDWRHRVLATISGYLDRYVYLFRVNQARRMRFSCKGSAPYPDGRRDRRDLSQLGVGAASPII